MKKAKRNAAFYLLLFLLVAAGAVYAILYGIGKERTGRAQDIPLGLDLQWCQRNLSD